MAFRGRSRQGTKTLQKPDINTLNGGEPFIASYEGQLETVCVCNMTEIELGLVVEKCKKHDFKPMFVAWKEDNGEDEKTMLSWFRSLMDTSYMEFRFGLISWSNTFTSVLFGEVNTFIPFTSVK